ncbi:MAG: Helix-turn-helix domain protein [bacterium ADurb.Bin236]|nr:MAG: Helix-turn-helix domain protein [bacterium ADurb.Bin236]HOY61772.1 helix-turn-helix domain-containing protein [bacterium]HPN93893.1 helix-turn-helix domain-containing protein [bacterium]
MARKKNEPPKERLYSIPEMSKMIQVDERTLVEWVQYRRIPHVRVDNKLVRFKLSDIAKWVRDKNKPLQKYEIK